MFLVTVFASALEILVTIICSVFITAAGDVVCVCGPTNSDPAPVAQPAIQPAAVGGSGQRVRTRSNARPVRPRFD